jgi:Zn-dependent peptidase ImmA (M78 family)
LFEELEGIEMKREPVVGIQPSVMQWARESIGLSIDDVALNLKRPLSEIEAWEAGTEAPTYAQLEKLAYTLYKRPLAVFFLPEPPEELAPRKEFRTLPESDLQTLSPDTHLHIRRAHAFQISLAELFSGRNPAAKLISRELQLAPDKSLSEQAQKVREFLAITIETQIAWSNEDVALKAWRQTIEAAGIFVFKNSFKQKDISGFCLAHDDLPIIYLNNSTTKTRQIFSLLHELAHLLLDMNGLSKFDAMYIDRLPSREKAIEIFCNAIAAEILIPSRDFQQQTQNYPKNLELVDDDYFVRLANRYGVSREAILRRFLDQKRVSSTFYEQKTKYWNGQKKSDGGGDWYASQNVYLSTRFAQEVVGQHYRRKLSVEQAADFLGIKVKNFSGLEQRILQGASA